MSTAMISVKIDRELKEEVQDIASKIGVNLSTVVKAKLIEFTKTKKLTLSLVEEPNDELIDVMKNVSKEKKSPVFSNAEEAVKWLDE